MLLELVAGSLWIYTFLRAIYRLSGAKALVGISRTTARGVA